MADQNTDTDSRRDGIERAAALLVGAGLGAVVALLFAPKAGDALRKDVADATRTGLDKAGDLYAGTAQKTRDVLSRVSGAETHSSSAEPKAKAVAADPAGAKS